MIPTEKRIKDIGYKGLNMLKLSKTESTETLLISLEKGHEIPKHISPKDTLLVVLSGEITFKMDDNNLNLETFDHYKFGAQVPHSVVARRNSKFLIIR